MKEYRWKICIEAGFCFFDKKEKEKMGWISFVRKLNDFIFGLRKNENEVGNDENYEGDEFLVIGRWTITDRI